MQITQTNDFQIAVINEFGETLQTFDQCDKDCAYDFFLLCLTPEQRKEENERILDLEVYAAIAAEEAANRQLSSDHYSSW